MSLTAIEIYEVLRSEVLRGAARPEGIGALVHHGMLTGLHLLTCTSASPAVASLREAAIPVMPHDRHFVRLLANMLLRTQMEVMHVY